jgi:hypothetical protein
MGTPGPGVCEQLDNRLPKVKTVQLHPAQDNATKITEPTVCMEDSTWLMSTDKQTLGCMAGPGILPAGGEGDLFLPQVDVALAWARQLAEQSS